MIEQTIDLSEAPLYTLDYRGSANFIDVYGYKFQLPLPPPDEEFINFGVPVEDQIFLPTRIPKSMNLWEKEDQEKFILAEYHRKNNGVWIFIKGKKYYIPGVFYFFLNYWKLKSGHDVIFRMTDLHFFYMLELCMRDPKCLGLIDFKCRQIGDTEKVICFIYWFATRYKNMKVGMQSLNDKHIKNTFKKMVFAHQNMMWYMKPQNKGSDNPEDGFIMQYPSTINSNKRNAQQFKQQGTSAINESELMYEHKAIGSEIMYGPSDAYLYDGQTLNIWYCDEFGKMKLMDPIEALGVVIPMMDSRILGKIIGKCIMTSTVEELKGGQTLKWAKQLWRDSDPAERGEDGFTGNQLYRVFRSALDKAPVDKWGFPKAEEELVRIKLKMNGFLKRRDIKGLIRFRRKNPITIEDVFMSAENESGFHIENLAERQIEMDGKEEKLRLAVPGNLKWKDGVRDSEVIWEPNPNGRWHISLHPSQHNFEENAQVQHVQLAKPANIHAFCGGVDPYDQKTNIENDLSLGGIVVRRKYDANYDGMKVDQLTGKPLNGGKDWETNRIVCDYLYRWQNPNDFYEDVILTFVYFGTEFLFEKNKGGGLESYIETRGYTLYLQDQPKQSRSKKADTKEVVGITATENSVNQLFELIQTETCDMAKSIRHPRYLAQLIRMNWENRGENDIGMAGGWAHVSGLRMRPKRQSDEERKETRHYTVNNV